MVDPLKDAIQGLCMFFAGLILLIPHRIGMSRVNYVIKRYQLPISRAGLLLYKFHNPIEVSLTIGTLLGNIINWIGGGQGWPMLTLSICMIVFLFLMLLSSIYMYRVYITGDDYGYLNHFYFSLILITLFDGFTNAFAFGINAAFASTLAAGIPTSGALVSLLHNIYKFFSDLFHWDNFDYHVLRIQLLCNVLGVLFTFILWSIDQGFDLILIEKHSSTGTGNCDEANFNLYATKGTYKWNADTTNIPCVHNKFSPGQLSALWQPSSGNE